MVRLLYVIINKVSEWSELERNATTQMLVAGNGNMQIAYLLLQFGETPRFHFHYVVVSQCSQNLTTSSLFYHTPSKCETICRWVLEKDISQLKTYFPVFIYQRCKCSKKWKYVNFESTVWNWETTSFRIHSLSRLSHQLRLFRGIFNPVDRQNDANNFYSKEALMSDNKMKQWSTP